MFIVVVAVTVSNVLVNAKIINSSSWADTGVWLFCISPRNLKVFSAMMQEHEWKKPWSRGTEFETWKKAHYRALGCTPLNRPDLNPKRNRSSYNARQKRKLKNEEKRLAQGLEAIPSRYHGDWTVILRSDPGDIGSASSSRVPAAAPIVSDSRAEESTRNVACDDSKKRKCEAADQHSSTYTDKIKACKQVFFAHNRTEQDWAEL